MKHPSQKKTILTHQWMKAFSASLTAKKPGNVLFIQLSLKHVVAGPITFDINFKTKKVEYFLKKSEICAYAGELIQEQIRIQRSF